MSERKPGIHDEDKPKELIENGFCILLDTVVLSRATAPERKHHIKVSGFMVVDNEFPVGFQAWRTQKDGNWMVFSPYSIFSCFPTEMTESGNRQLLDAIGELTDERKSEIVQKTGCFQNLFRLSEADRSKKQKRQHEDYKEIIRTIADHKRALS